MYQLPNFIQKVTGTTFNTITGSKSRFID